MTPRVGCSGMAALFHSRGGLYVAFWLNLVGEMFSQACMNEQGALGLYSQ